MAVQLVSGKRGWYCFGAYLIGAVLMALLPGAGRSGERVIGVGVGYASGHPVAPYGYPLYPAPWVDAYPFGYLPAYPYPRVHYRDQRYAKPSPAHQDPRWADAYLVPPGAMTPHRYPSAYRGPGQALPGYASPPYSAPGYAPPSAFSQSLPDRDGWELLALGSPGDAQRVFGYLADREPSAGRWELGYALASAARGDLVTGVLAMRQAVRIEPQVLKTQQFPPGVRLVVQGLLGSYGAYPRRDGAFMQASLYLLLGDRVSAQAALDEASRVGDDSGTIRALQYLVSQPATRP